MDARPYQVRTVRECLWKLRACVPTLLVAPTGAGKTFMMAEIGRQLQGSTGWVCHTQDLVEQSATKLREYGLRVGVIAAGYEPDPFAPFQVASVQTLLARDIELRVDNLFLDEAHHYAASEYRQAVTSRHVKRTLGATATPERADGKPLGDIFQELVVAAHYSELIAGGWLVPVRVLRPTEELAKGLAQKFVQAYIERGEGLRCFGYARTKKEARELAEQLSAAGHPFGVISDETPKDERRALLEALSLGEIRGLTSVHALSEGVDVPAAACCVLGGNIGHAATYLQRVGRVLRASPGKREALVLDLPGVSHRLGLPCEDRVYALRGEGIRRSDSALSMRCCLYCGMTFVPKGDGNCPRCGEHNPTHKKAPPKIYNRELETVYAGAETPDWAKRGELDRLRAVARARGLGLGWASREYQNLFGERPRATMRHETGDEEKREEWDRLLRLAERRGYARGWAMHRYKATFGAFPPRQWTMVGA